MTGRASSAIAIHTWDGKVELMRFESQYPAHPTATRRRGQYRKRPTGLIFSGRPAPGVPKAIAKPE